MRRGLLLLVLGVLGAVIGVASARASGVGTTGTTTTTTSATTTTSTPSYAPLATSVLPASCVGAGAAAVVPPSHSAVTVGTPASNLGPSGYPSSASVVAFASASASGSACKSARITLTSVSLFEGAVTATSVAATDGKGTVTGLEIGGAAVSAAPGQTLAVGNWGQLAIGERFGRVTAPLVLTLLQGHGSLGPGTRIAVAFSAAAPPPAVTPTKKSHSTASSSQPTLHLSQRYAKGSSAGETRGREGSKRVLDLPGKQPYPFLSGGGGLTPAARHNPVVSIAMRYLGIPYRWGGASPGTGFDCSGLVQYVFAKVGVSLVHYAASQYDYPDSVWVSPKRLQPGDLVFFVGSDGTRKAPGHVGIYVDDGYFIDAPHTGSFVRIDSLTDPRFADQYIAAKRIVGAPTRARRLFHATDPTASATTFPVGFPTMTLEPLGQSLGVTPAVATTPHRYWIWIGAALGGLLLVLGSGAGAWGFRRRRRAPGRAGESAISMP